MNDKQWRAELAQWRTELARARTEARAAQDRLAVLALEAHQAGVPLPQILKATGWSRSTFYRKLPKQLELV